MSEFKFLSEAHSIDLELEPCIGLLGADNAFCSKYQTQAISLCMMLAKRLILQMWKSDYVPIFEMWAIRNWEICCSLSRI